MNSEFSLFKLENLHNTLLVQPHPTAHGNLIESDHLGAIVEWQVQVEQSEWLQENIGRVDNLIAVLHQRTAHQISEIVNRIDQSMATASHQASHVQIIVEQLGPLHAHHWPILAHNLGKIVSIHLVDRLETMNPPIEGGIVEENGRVNRLPEWLIQLERVAQQVVNVDVIYGPVGLNVGRAQWANKVLVVKHQDGRGRVQRVGLWSMDGILHEVRIVCAQQIGFNMNILGVHWSARDNSNSVEMQTSRHVLIVRINQYNLVQWPPTIDQSVLHNQIALDHQSVELFASTNLFHFL